MIRLVGDSALRRVGEPEKDIGSSAFNEDLGLLIKVLRESGGVGIAAPQLAISRRLLLIESKPNKRYPCAPSIDLMIIVNPVIVRESLDLELGWEGCLSVPGKRAKVKRSKRVHLKYSDQLGASREVTLSGYAARIFLHEYDHLEGVTILDRVSDESLVISEEEYFSEILPL